MSHGFVRAALAATLFLSAAVPAFAQARGIEGVWGMTITVRDCTTGGPRARRS